MEIMKGYALYTSSTPTTIDFTGYINSGSKSTTLTHTSSQTEGGNTNEDGWNLVGNPYPCPIDWNATSGWTKTNVDDAVYIYEPGSCNGNPYKTYVNGVGVPGTVTGIIAPMQGFFVHAFSNGILEMNNSVRVSTTTARFYKKKQPIKELRIKAYNADTPNLYDETAIYFTNNATHNFDKNADAMKLMNNDRHLPNIYSLTDENKKLAINGIPLLTCEELIIPLGISVSIDGNYEINANDIKDFYGETNIWLVDKELNNRIQVINENPVYKFFIRAGNNENRFYLKLYPKNSVNVVQNRYDENMINAYYYNNNIHITLSSQFSVLNSQLSILNLLGQEIYKTQISNLKSQISTANFEKGTYIIKFIGNNSDYVKKINIIK
jgi:hypothetical protein